MFVNRVLQQAGNTFVESQQDATRGSSSLQHRSVFCPRESLLNDAIGVVPKPPEIIREFPRQILIELKSHFPRIGSKRSSFANSAAYASADSMCSSLREGYLFRISSL